ncbi:MAG: tetrahydrofolate dehydrogenase/cyclohydrolase catalytic domain-containing protein [Bacilli bacterium]
MNNVIDGKETSKKIKQELKEKIKSQNIFSSLAVVQIGNNASSNIYVRNKKSVCEELGIAFKLIKFDEAIAQDLVIIEINKLNNDPLINGIIVQLPLPKGFNEGEIINTIIPIKDVDGLTYTNVGNLSLENECLVSCTPLGVMALLKNYQVNLTSKNVVIVGRSNLVGKPLIQLLLKENATVTICHSKSKNIKNFTKNADVLIVAAGHPNLITKEMVKEKVIVIDVGITRENDLICGDVDYSSVSKKAALITPVPGGVGPMTVTMLMKNVVKAYEFQNQKLKKRNKEVLQNYEEQF